VCVAALAILDKLDEEVDREMLSWWLVERQLPNGGLNGRPEKLEDVRIGFLVAASTVLSVSHALSTGMLQLLGAVVTFNLDQIDLDRREEARIVHIVCPSRYHFSSFHTHAHTDSYKRTLISGGSLTDRVI
jgi:hypothetical protein